MKRETNQLEKTVLCLSVEMCEEGGNSNRENNIMFISWNVWKERQLNKRKQYYVYLKKCGKREITQLEKIVVCLSQEIWEKGDNSIRENSIMFISWNVWGRQLN